jgi:hypothetical protein
MNYIEPLVGSAVIILVVILAVIMWRASTPKIYDSRSDIVGSADTPHDHHDRFTNHKVRKAPLPPASTCRRKSEDRRKNDRRA